MRESLEMNVNKQESPEGLFETSVKKGVKESLMKVKERCERSPESKDNFPFHYSGHSEDVIRRTRNVLLARFGATEKTINTLTPEQKRIIEMGGLFASGHDTVQEWEAENQMWDPEKKMWTATVEKVEWDEASGKWLIDGKPWVPLRDGKEFRLFRKRFAGANEEKSGDEMVLFMKKENERAKQNVFSEEEIPLAKKTIVNGTVPDFDKKLGTVVQKGLEKLAPATIESDLATSVALGDLGAAGMDGKEAYLKDGDALFREENLDILEAMKNAEKITEPEKESYKKRMLSWSRFQEIFAAGRKARLDTECARFTDQEAQERIKKLFSKFDESIEAAKKKAEARETMTLEELAQDMGYSF